MSQKGVADSLQKTLEAVRVIGPNAVEPGMLDERDTSLTAYTLFGCINLICEMMITKAMEIKRLSDTGRIIAPDNLK